MNLTPRLSLIVCISTLLLVTASIRAESTPPAPRLEPGRKWVFNMTNFGSDAGTDKLIALMQRAKTAGYNGFVLSDVKFEKFQLANSTLLKNVKRFREAARTANMDVIACVAPFGYADFMLSNDPNLAEGMPVRKAEFIVKNGKLVPFDETTKLINGSLEDWKGDAPVGWKVEEPGKVSFRDEAAHEGKTCLRQQDVPSSGGRLFQQITVLPWHYYHISVWIKIEDCASKDWRITAWDGEHVLAWQGPTSENLKKTQDWQQYHATFCSLENTSVSLRIGCWSGKKGKVWFDDVRIEPAGFVNIIRRDSTPLKVTSADEQTVYTEGKDFDRVVDPKLGRDPNPGQFSNWHESPVVSIPTGSRLKEGDKILANYNFACTCGKPNNINMCMSEPKTYDIIEKQVRWVKENVQPDIYMMAHDEIRMNGWDDTCAATGKTSGQILADNVRRCTAIIKKVAPGKPIVVWNDLFDPYHNAREKDDAGKPFIDYMVKGNWVGSWEGLPPDVGIVNWSGGKLDSYQFFAKRGNQQIISGNKPTQIGEWLDSCKDLPGIAGAMYTTWDNDFGPVVEKYVEMVKEYESHQNKP